MLKQVRVGVRRLLKWSERHVKTDMTYLAKGGSFLLADQFIAVGSAIVLSIGFANLLPKEVFGTYQFILSVAATIGAFTLTGINAAIVRAVAKGNEGALKRGFSIRLKWNALTLLISLAVATYYFIQGNNTLAIGFLIVGSFLPLLTSFGLYAPFLEGKKAFNTLTYYGIIRNTIPPAILLLTLVLTNNPLLILLSYYVSNTLMLAILYLRTLKVYVRNGAHDEKLSTHGMHLSFMNILTMGVDQLDKILVFHYLGAVELAVYAFAMAPIKQLRSFNKIVKVLALPKLAANDIPTIKQTLPRKALLLFFVMVAVVIVYVLAAPYLYKVLFPQYVESVTFSQVAALSLLALPIVLFKRVFLAHMKKKELYVMQVITPTLHIGFLLFLIPTYGIWGAVMATLLTYIVDATAALTLFRRLS